MSAPNVVSTAIKSRRLGVDPFGNCDDGLLMDSGRFGPPTGSAASGDDPFGYFGGTPSPGIAAGQPQASAFTGQSAPSGSSGHGPVSQFGGPVDYPAPPGAASAYAPPVAPASSGKKAIPKAVMSLVALLVVGAGVFGWNVYERSRPITMPATFAGLPVNTNPTAQAAMHNVMSSLQSKNPGVQMNEQIYGSGTSEVVVAAVRANDAVSSDLTSPSLQPTTMIGSNTCAKAVSGPTSICVRSQASLTVVVLAVGGTPESTSALLDQAWSQF